MPTSISLPKINHSQRESNIGFARVTLRKEFGLNVLESRRKARHVR